MYARVCTHISMQPLASCHCHWYNTFSSPLSQRNGSRTQTANAVCHLFRFSGELDLFFILACICHASLRNGGDNTKRRAKWKRMQSTTGTLHGKLFRNHQQSELWRQSEKKWCPVPIIVPANAAVCLYQTDSIPATRH